MLPLQFVIHINIPEFLAAHGTQLVKKHFYVQLIIQGSGRFVQTIPNMAGFGRSERFIVMLAASLRYLWKAAVDVFVEFGVQDSYVSPLGEILLLCPSPKWLQGWENTSSVFSRTGASKSGSTFKFGRTGTWELLGELESFYQRAHHDSAQAVFEVKVFHCWVRYHISATEAHPTHPL